MTSSEEARRRAGATKRQRIEDRLLAAARDVFDTRGWHGTKVKDVAKAAGIGLATTYKHFSTKQRLVERAYAPLLNALTGAVRKSDPLASATQYMRGLADIAEQHSALATVMVLAAHSDGSEAFNQVVDALAGIIKSGQRQGRFNPRANAQHVATFYIVGLLSLAAMGRHGPGQLAQFVLSQMLPALQT